VIVKTVQIFGHILSEEIYRCWYLPTNW